MCNLTAYLNQQTLMADTIIVKPDEGGRLTSHPAKKQVMEFLKQLVVDSLSLPPSSKGPHTIDYLLDVSILLFNSVYFIIFLVCSYDRQLIPLSVHLLGQSRKQ